MPEFNFPEKEWNRDAHGTWWYRIGEFAVWITARPPYCDRGHFQSVTHQVPDIDDSDRFPRYFMDLERAKAEMAEWLAWKLSQHKKSVGGY